MEEDGEAHLYKGCDQEDQKETSYETQLIDVLLACPFDHLLNVQDVVRIARVTHHPIIIPILLAICKQRALSSQSKIQQGKHGSKINCKGSDQTGWIG